MDRFIFSRDKFFEFSFFIEPPDLNESLEFALTIFFCFYTDFREATDSPIDFFPAYFLS